MWVGTGENNNRQSGSWGNGVYKSIDGGQTWKHMGLRDSKHIARIIVDPIDHDVVYVAALGSLWGPGKERGVFKTTDGGLTWTNVLFVNEDTGATELVQDPSNNKVLYAATYQRRRATWGFNGGGPGSAIYKTSDAGRTWTKLTNGIPAGPLGRIGMDIYRANPNILYARIEHQHRERHLPLGRCGADVAARCRTSTRGRCTSARSASIPTNDLRVYVLGVQLHISDDGGTTFIENGALHSDHHAMWINPTNSNHIIDGNDGGVGHQLGQGQDVGRDLQHGSRAVLPRRLRHGDAVQPVRRHAGQLHLVRAERRAQPQRHRQRRLVPDSGRRRLRGGDRSERSRHDLRRIAGRQHRARQSPHQRAQDHPAAAGSRRVRLCAGTGTRRFTSRRTARRRSTSAPIACSGRPIAGSRGRRSAAT